MNASNLQGLAVISNASLIEGMGKLLTGFPPFPLAARDYYPQDIGLETGTWLSSCLLEVSQSSIVRSVDSSSSPCFPGHDVSIPVESAYGAVCCCVLSTEALVIFCIVYLLMLYVLHVHSIGFSSPSSPLPTNDLILWSVTRCEGCWLCHRKFLVHCLIVSLTCFFRTMIFPTIVKIISTVLVARG